MGDVVREIVMVQEVRKSLFVELIGRFAGAVWRAGDGKYVVIVQIRCR